MRFKVIQQSLSLSRHKRKLNIAYLLSLLPGRKLTGGFRLPRGLQHAADLDLTSGGGAAFTAVRAAVSVQMGENQKGDPFFSPWMILQSSPSLTKPLR